MIKTWRNLACREKVICHSCLVHLISLIGKIMSSLGNPMYLRRRNSYNFFRTGWGSTQYLGWDVFWSIHYILCNLHTPFLSVDIILLSILSLLLPHYHKFPLFSAHRCANKDKESIPGTLKNKKRYNYLWHVSRGFWHCSMLKCDGVLAHQPQVPSYPGCLGSVLSLGTQLTSDQMEGKELCVHHRLRG